METRTALRMRALSTPEATSGTAAVFNNKGAEKTVDNNQHDSFCDDFFIKNFLVKHIWTHVP